MILKNLTDDFVTIEFTKDELKHIINAFFLATEDVENKDKEFIVDPFFLKTYLQSYELKEIAVNGKLDSFSRQFSQKISDKIEALKKEIEQ